MTNIMTLERDREGERKRERARERRKREKERKREREREREGEKERETKKGERLCVYKLYVQKHPSFLILSLPLSSHPLSCPLVSSSLFLSRLILSLPFSCHPLSSSLVSSSLFPFLPPLLPPPSLIRHQTLTHVCSSPVLPVCLSVFCLSSSRRLPQEELPLEVTSCLCLCLSCVCPVFVLCLSCVCPVFARV